MSTARMWSREPHPFLRPYVRSYVEYRQSGVTLPLHRGLPGGAITFVLSLLEPIRMVAGPGGAVAHDCAIAGLHFAPAVIAQDSEQHGMHIELHPLGVHALLGVPSGELTGTVRGLADIPVRLSSLVDQLRARSSAAERFSLLDNVFLSVLEPRTIPGEVTWAWRRLLASHGAVRVAELAAEVGWSRRHFSQRFAEFVGATPKQAGRLLRFQRSTALVRGGLGSLAEVAAEAGYYDQAQLSNDWREFAGLSPRQWIRAELPFLQDSSSVDR